MLESVQNDWIHADSSEDDRFWQVFTRTWSRAYSDENGRFGRNSQGYGAMLTSVQLTNTGECLVADMRTEQHEQGGSTDSRSYFKSGEFGN
ncbi:hypothetical protein AVEN_60210-1 [Araneus ventricosus]|uniref:Uncharacterized protein n=1 Tax=Araneus ventricosus TaxID=182803 RepID=A0A4Y2CKU2_ARAVE|nr:hypothetical protein AVEN_60210-1 [Araneus ventricosus]